MNFKTKEDLVDKAKEEMLGTDVFESGVEKAFELFVERKEFYEKYEGKPEYFKNRFPRNEWWSKNKDKYQKLNTTMVPARDYYEGHYNLKNLIEEFDKWLYGFCFGDIE